mmetsp:Transcript_58604/g.174463  ORF Transcript_58604/g.174463 Transcript_58604/m.174463 type:complete len:642 (-) Transcript_58604:389-2314(-)
MHVSLSQRHSCDNNNEDAGFVAEGHGIELTESGYCKKATETDNFSDSTNKYNGLFNISRGMDGSTTYLQSRHEDLATETLLTGKNSETKEHVEEGLGTLTVDGIETIEGISSLILLSDESPETKEHVEVGLATLSVNNIEASVDGTQIVLANEADTNKCKAFEGATSSALLATSGTKTAGCKAARCQSHASVERGAGGVSMLTTNQRAARSRATGAEDVIRSARTVATYEMGSATVAAYEEVELAANASLLRAASSTGSPVQVAKHDTKLTASSLLDRATKSKKTSDNKVGTITKTIAESARDMTRETYARVADLSEVAAKRAAKETARMAREFCEVMETLAEERKDIARDIDDTLEEVTDTRERLKKRGAFIDGRIYSFYDGIETPLVKVGILTATESYTTRESSMHFEDDDTSMGTGYTSAYSIYSKYSTLSMGTSQSVHHSPDIPMKNRIVRFEHKPFYKEAEQKQKDEINTLTSGGNERYDQENEENMDDDRRCESLVENEERNDNLRPPITLMEYREGEADYPSAMPFQQWADVLNQLKFIFRESDLPSDAGVKSVLLKSKCRSDAVQKMPLSRTDLEKESMASTLYKGLKSHESIKTDIVAKKLLVRKKISVRKQIGIKRRGTNKRGLVSYQSNE